MDIDRLRKMKIEIVPGLELYKVCKTKIFGSCKNPMKIWFV